MTTGTKATTPIGTLRTRRKTQITTMSLTLMILSQPASSRIISATLMVTQQSRTRIISEFQKRLPTV